MINEIFKYQDNKTEVFDEVFRRRNTTSNEALACGLMMKPYIIPTVINLLGEQ